MDCCGVVRGRGGGIKSYEGGAGRYRSALGKLRRLAKAEARDPVMLEVTAGSLGNGNGSGGSAATVVITVAWMRVQR